MSTKEEIMEVADKLSEHFANEIIDHPSIGGIAGGSWLRQHDRQVGANV